MVKNAPVSLLKYQDIPSGSTKFTGFPAQYEYGVMAGYFPSSRIGFCSLKE